MQYIVIGGVCPEITTACLGRKNREERGEYMGYRATFYKRCGCPDASCMQEVLGLLRRRAIIVLLSLLEYSGMSLAGSR